MIFYKRYPYSPKATLISAACSLFALMLVIIGVMLVKESLADKNYVSCIIGVLIAAAAVPVHIFGSNRLSKKIADKDGLKNIKTKAKYAKLFVQSHPEAYDQLIRENAAFAKKYVRDANGKIVKRG